MENLSEVLKFPLAEGAGDVSNSLVGTQISTNPEDLVQGAHSYPNNIAQPDGSSVLDNALANYDANTQDALVGRLGAAGDSMIAGARSSAQQTANFPYQNWNLAKSNPRGNLNNRSFATTERFSRLADMLNNQVYFDPGDAVTTVNPITGEASSRGTASASVNRWEPIETQEMRQMRANERLDEQARQAQVELQAGIQAYPQELQELKDRTVMELTDYVLRSEDNIYRYWQQMHMNLEYQGTFEQFIQMRYMKYLNDLDLGKKSDVLKFLLRQSQDVGNLATMVYGVGGNVPGFFDKYFSQMALEILNDDTIPDFAQKVYTFQANLRAVGYALSTQDAEAMLKQMGNITDSGAQSNAERQGSAARPTVSTSSRR